MKKALLLFAALWSLVAGFATTGTNGVAHGIKVQAQLNFPWTNYVTAVTIENDTNLLAGTLTGTNSFYIGNPGSGVLYRLRVNGDGSLEIDQDGTAVATLHNGGWIVNSLYADDDILLGSDNFTRGNPGELLVHSMTGDYVELQTITDFHIRAGNDLAGTTNFFVAPASGYDGSTNLFLSSDGFYHPASGGEGVTNYFVNTVITNLTVHGHATFNNTVTITTNVYITNGGNIFINGTNVATINPTDNFLPYRTSATTFGDSPISVVATNVARFNAGIQDITGLFTSDNYPAIEFLSLNGFSLGGGNELIYSQNNLAAWASSVGFFVFKTNTVIGWSEDPGHNSPILAIYPQVGSPEGVLSAQIGSLALRTDGSSGSTLYIKESGFGNTGWVAISGGGGLFATNSDGIITNNTAPPSGKLMLSLSADQTNGSFQVATNGAAFFGVHSHPYMEAHGYLDNETAWASVHDPFLGDPNWNEWIMMVKNSDTGAFGSMGGYAYEGKAKIYIENGTGDVTMDTTSTDSSVSVNRSNTSVWAGVEDTDIGKIFIRLNGTNVVFLAPMSADGVTPHILDTANVVHTTGNLFEVKNGKTNKFTVDFAGNLTAKLIATPAAATTIASGATIAPTEPITFVSGVGAIATITVPTPISGTGGQLTLIPDGVFTTTLAGNIALASTAVVGKALIMTYDSGTSKWYPSY